MAGSLDCKDILVLNYLLLMTWDVVCNYSLAKISSNFILHLQHCILLSPFHLSGSGYSYLSLSFKRNTIPTDD